MFQLDLLEPNRNENEGDASSDAVLETASQEIAIIGISAKLPKSDTHREFWDMLQNGVDGVRSFPQSRRQELEPYLRRMSALYETISIFDGAYLEDISSFDYSFFRLSPKEASLMSPNQRMFLQTAWSALEDGGYGGEALHGSRTGVFIGHNADALHDYKRIIETVNPEALAMAAPGNLSSMIAGRISYLLNLKGPALNVDTACSSSLVAVHLACQSIRSGECDAAIAGSVKLNLLPIDMGIRLGIESSDNRAKPFDDSSDGTGIGDGVVALLLKPLAKALQDGDHVYALIKGSAMNQDGSSVGITAPNALAQEDVIVRAWQDAAIDPETIMYLEAHGTGTTLGDPIEIDGITRAFRRFTDKRQFCAIGSVKSNIGHLDHAAGITGLLKAVLSLCNKQIPPTLHYRFPNRKISFVDSPVYVNDKLSHWSDEFGARRCGISAFGMSGTNCHVVLEEAPSMSMNDSVMLDEVAHAAYGKEKNEVFCLSAQSESALKRSIINYRAWFADQEQHEWSLTDICYSAAIGRGHYRYRLAIVAKNEVELRNRLEALDVERLKNTMMPNIYYGDSNAVHSGGNDERKQKELLEQVVRSNWGNDGASTQLAQLYAAGAKVDWKELYRDERRRRVPLPVYSFDPYPCWVEEDDRSVNIAPLTEFKHESAVNHVRLCSEGAVSESEQSVANVWGELLGYRELSNDANFYELGGDSIIALRIVNSLSQSWGIRLEVQHLLGHPTLSGFAGVVEERRLSGSPETEKVIHMPLVAEREYYTISSSQKRMYLQQAASPSDRSYNLPELLHIEGEIDAGRLEASIHSLIKRHEMLRTSFALVDGEICQFVHTDVHFSLQRLQASEETVLETLHSLFTSFDLSHAPLLRAALLTVNPERHVLYLDMHHIASDGFSAGILLKELMMLYRGESLEPLTLRYIDYAAWQREELQSERMERQRSYWMKQCQGEWPVLELPTDFPRPLMKSNRGETFDMYVDNELSDNLRKLAKSTESTLFMVLLSVYFTLLAKYSGGEDIAVGTPIAGRVNRETETLVGMFVGTLVLRGYPVANKPFTQFLEEIKAASTEAYENSDFPFEELASMVDRRDSSRNPLFDTMFIMQNLNIPNYSNEELTYRHERFPHGTAKYDLMVQAVEQNDGTLRLVVEFGKDLFREETVRSMMRHYIALLSYVTDYPEHTLGECEMLSPQDYNKLLTEFGSRASAFPSARCIHSSFEEQARRVPGRVAVQCRGESLTYEQLNGRANALARKLVRCGVGPNSIVGVMAERSISMVTGMLAIMKAGGAYLPIDLQYPQERTRYMLADSGASLLLVDDSVHRNAYPSAQEIRLKDETIYDGDKSNVDVSISADDLMYVIYTSGSTGQPKGVMVPHRSFYNFSHSLKLFYDGNFDERDRCLSLTNISFDVSVCELFMPFMFGASLVLYPNPKLLDPRELAKVIVEEQITFAYIPPTLLRDVAQSLEQSRMTISLDKLLVGVEPIKDTTLALFVQLNPNIRIVNGYGPTEATICSNMYVYKSAAASGVNVPIGGPMHGVAVHILNFGDKPAPVGSAGELCISGSGLAAGYVNKPELTAERFVEHPLQPGTIMYRTGDLAKWLPDGNTMYLGRMDDQIKLRGIRIELGEIGAQLQRHEAVDEAVIIAHEDQAGDKKLCAYMVVNQTIGAQDLKSFLKSKMPDYMIPSFFMEIAAIPLTPNGKVDRKALPEPVLQQRVVAELTLPRTSLEAEVAEIWRDVLGIEQISMYDDFFELGGHSLKAAVLVSRIQAKFHVEMPLSVVFERLSVASMAEWLAGGTLLNSELGIGGAIIPMQANRDHYPMSPAQRRQYMIELIAGQSTMYHIPFVLHILGNLEKKKLEAAFTALITRHESLRTSFHYVGEEFCQRIHPAEPFQLTEMVIKGEQADLWQRASSAIGADVRINELMAPFTDPFDLGSGSLLRVGLAELAENRHLLLLNIHHIVTDGISMSVLIKELIDLYNGQALPELTVQYRDYAVWELERLSGDYYSKLRRYWLGMFSDELPVLDLPADKQRPAVQRYEGRRFAFQLNEELAHRARQLAREQGTTLYTLLLSAYTVLLGKYSGQEDIIVGTPVAGRNHIDVERLIGMFVNTVAIRCRPQFGMTIGSYITEMHGNVLQALEHQEFPFEDLVNQLEMEQDLSRNPLFNTMFILQNMEQPARQAGDLIFEPQPYETGFSKFDLSLEAVETGKGITCCLEYATSLFHESTIERMAAHFCTIVKEMTSSEGSRRTIGELELVDEAERLKLSSPLASAADKAEQKVNDIAERVGKVLLGETNVIAEMTAMEAHFSASTEEYPCWMSIMEEIERQAAETPHAAAILFGLETLSYFELNERANRLADTLRSRGVGPERIVALMADRSPLMMIGILGILKAGGAYVAIDPAYPAERIQWMLEDCGDQWLLTERKYAGFVMNASEEWYLDDADLYSSERGNLEIVSRPEHLAYVLYTSGSTGRPKGAMIEHRGLASFVSAFRERIPFEAGQSILAMATVSFDIFIVENLLPLTMGMRIVLCNEEERSDAHLLQELINKHRVEVLQITPSRFKWWMAQVSQSEVWKSLSVVMIGAEPLTMDLLGRLRSVTNARIFNLYGPTETTVWTSVCEVTSGENITIGKPISGAAMVVLNPALQLQPTGVIGEICILGAGVGRGYLRHPEWDQGVFITSPFGTGERMYRTGDLGRRLANGEFVYAGRRDHQVKIRGHRIETGEVEQQLLLYERVKEAVVIAFQEEEGEHALCAYVVPASDSSCNNNINEHNLSDMISELQTHLSSKLPAYMIPAYVMLLDAIPLTPTGKLHRKALPKPHKVALSERKYLRPRNETERKLAELWKDLLKSDDIGVMDSFFELGGHSLKAAALVSRIHEHFGVHVPLRELFLNPTLGSLAEVIEGKHLQTYESIPRQMDQEHYPMSHAQRRQYLLGLLTGESTMYHVPFALRIRGKLDASRLEAAFSSLVARHESLRTSFHYMDEQFRQRVHPATAFHFEDAVEELVPAGKWLGASGDEVSAESEWLNELTTKFIRPFDLESGLLLRAGLLQLEEEHYLLLLDIHHIVTDGVSMSVLVKELTALYGGNELPELRVQYRDYAVWQEGQLGGEAIEAHERYWLKKFEGELPLLELPTDRKRPIVQTFKGRKYVFHLDGELAQRARRLAAEQGVTLYSVLLSAYAFMLGKYSGQEDIIIGTPVAGRNHVDVEGLIGMFVNTAAIRCRPQLEHTVSSYVAELHEDVLQALEHQEYPFEKLVERLNLVQDKSRNPLFDTMFILQNMEHSALQSGGLSFEPQPFEHGVSKFDLTLEAVERAEGIAFSLEYATDLFHEETVIRMAHHYCAIIKAMTSSENRLRTLGELELLNDEEKLELLAALDSMAWMKSSGADVEGAIALGDAPAKMPLSLQGQDSSLPGVPFKWRSVIEEIEKQAAKTPDAVAVHFESEQMTYRELNDRSNQLAHTLRSRGVGPERIVALMADRSPLLMIGILGILKAGGAYVAIDPAYPAERIQWMLEDCGDQWLLTERKYAGFVMNASEEWYLDDADLYSSERGNLEIVSRPEHLAYVLYTSGSTGRPKGAMIEHRGLASFVSGFRERIPFEAGQSLLAMATVSFDIFIVESLLPLTMGMKMVLCNEVERSDAHLLQELIKKHRVEVLQITPSRFKWWMAQVSQSEVWKSLSVVMIGAEPLTMDLLERLRAMTSARIFNLYGPTETTVWTSVFEVTSGEAITIGTPIAGAAMVVLSPELQLQPTGVIGEICILGAGVGRGYLRHPEWDQGVFITSPFNAEERMYRTGDLGRRLANGEFVYAGRRDHQVKIRGHRIETGEVEQQLLQHERVKEAVVIAFQEPEGEPVLCAYVVLQKADDADLPNMTSYADHYVAAALESIHKEETVWLESVDGHSLGVTEELIEHLRGKLPAYMIPTYVMLQDEIPMTPTGKINRKALPRPQQTERNVRHYREPSTETERKLVMLWQDLLLTDNIGATDSFFELGGHSLKAATLVSRIGLQFGVRVPLRELFQNPTIELLALVIEGQSQQTYESIPRQMDRAYFPMSRAQRRQYVLSLLSGEATMYNVPFALHIRGNLDAKKLEQAFTALIMRHESLRTSFHYEDGQFKQRIHPSAAFKLDGNAWARMTAKRLLSETGMHETITRLMARFIRPFDLGSCLLLRAALVPLSSSSHLLLLDMHHIVTDGVSVSVLLKELIELYSGNELAELRVQYRDYAVWQEAQLNGPGYEAHERHWLDMFSGELPILELQTDNPRPAMQSFVGRRYSFRLNEELTRRAQHMAKVLGTTLYTVLLGAYALLLGKYSGQQDIIIGTPTAGRDHVDLEGQIGIFVNTVAIRCRPQPERTLGGYIADVHNDVLQALEHQEYPFEDLVKRLELGKNLSRNPLFDTMFILQNMDRSVMQGGDLTFELQPFEPGVSKFDLTLEVVESNGEMICSLEYATALFHSDTITRMAQHYCATVEEMTAAASPLMKLSDLSLQDGPK
ncbi:amino acid adenylation domain-containing protein [Paenibacillus sp. MCAF9]|uniref:amino acid adenylation domain-containing protein n=1 Tax=Paenibacillus sp. MCAF9 TaxID=3233046 RepID=UPI003F9C531A